MSDVVYNAAEKTLTFTNDTDGLDVAEMTALAASIAGDSNIDTSISVKKEDHPDDGVVALVTIGDASWHLVVTPADTLHDTDAKSELVKVDNSDVKVELDGSLDTAELQALGIIPAPVITTGTQANYDSVTSFDRGSGTSFSKFVQQIAQIMNDKFAEIMDMSQVLSSGRGINGIFALAENNVTIDGVPISEMLKQANGGYAIGKSPTTNGFREGLIDRYIDFQNMLADGEFNLGAINTEDNNIWFFDQKEMVDGEVVIERDGDGNIINGQWFNFGSTGDFELQIPEDTDFSDWKPTDIGIKLTNFDTILENPGTLFLVQQLLQQVKDSLAGIGAIGKVPGDQRSKQVQQFERAVGQ